MLKQGGEGGKERRKVNNLDACKEGVGAGVLCDTFRFQILTLN